MYKLTVNIEEYNNNNTTKHTELLGVFTTIEAAKAEARREIIRLSAEDNTDAELKNHHRGSLCSCGAVFKFGSAESSEFKEVRHYWAEKVAPKDMNTRYALHLYEDERIAEDYPELNALLLKYITDGLK